MIIIKVSGGLGNQLQQYAMYEKFRMAGKEVRLDLDWYDSTRERGTARELELDRFPGVSYRVCTEEERQSILNGGMGKLRSRLVGKLFPGKSPVYREHRMYDPHIFELEDKLLEGYFACEAYYGDILPVLRETLTFPDPGNPVNEEMRQRMEATASVSIHLRRGDYLAEENKAMFGGICTEAYYRRAEAIIREKVKHPHFYVFSDDTEYAKEQYPSEEYTVVDINHGKDSLFDMYLMSCCKHNICANSTFSFWGARLGSDREQSGLIEPEGKGQLGQRDPAEPEKKAQPTESGHERIKIRPLKQKNGVDWYQPEAMRKLWKGWICIDENGETV